MGLGVVWRLGLLAGLTCASGCTERLIREGDICSDGLFRPGEVCLFSEDEGRTFGTDIMGISIRAEDFTGDGHIDILVMGQDATGIVVGRTLAGDGEGNFAAPVDAAIISCSAHPVPGVVDGDEATDLLVDDCNENMSLYRGSSTGRFEEVQKVFVGARTRTSGLLQLDGSGPTEVVVLGTAAAGGPVLNAAFRDGTGTAGVASHDVSDPEFDAKGFALLVPERGQPPVAYLVDSESPRGGYVRVTDPWGEPAHVGALEGTTVDWVSLRDFDADGEPELLWRDAEAGTVDVAELERGAPIAGSEARTEDVPLGLGRYIADVDADGLLDLVLTEPGETSLAVRLGTEDLRFAEAVTVQVGVQIEQYHLRDFDEDGAVDLVVGPEPDGSVLVVLADP